LAWIGQFLIKLNAFQIMPNHSGFQTKIDFGLVFFSFEENSPLTLNGKRASFKPTSLFCTKPVSAFSTDF